MGKDWQTDLFDRHRSWVEPAHPSTSVGDGWSDVLERLFGRIGSALALRAPEVRLNVTDIKEKYGTLRFSWFGGVDDEVEAAIEDAVLLAELRSACTCDVCGAEGGLRSTRSGSGWLAVRCPAHADGFPVEVNEGVWLRREGGRTYSITYDRLTDTLRREVVAPSD